MERWFRRYGIHLIFVLTLASLAALLTHWIFLLRRNETGLVRASWKALQLSARTAAAELGARQEKPSAGPLAGYRHLEVVRSSETGGDSGGDEAGAWPATPNWPQWAVRPSPARLAELRQRRSARIVMVVGEGVLAGLLVTVCVIMLYRLFRLERKQRAEAEFFLGSVTHELKSPMTGLKALLQTLSKHKIPEDERAQYLRMGLFEADRLEHLVENCLLAARMKQRGLDVSVKDVHLEPLLRGFVKHRQAIRAGKEPAVPLSGDNLDNLVVAADPDRLRVILENLLDNGFKHGGPDVEVKIRVLTEGERWVCVRVEDNGRGFPPHTADNLFDGIRLDEAGREKSGGVGLGLGISRHLVRLMGGELTARSDGPGKGGSMFEIRLVRRTDRPAPETDRTAAEEDSGGDA